MKNNYDWSGMFQTIAAKVAKCTSEEQMYRILKDFKDEFRRMGLLPIDSEVESQGSEETYADSN